MNPDKLREELKRDEGFSRKPYKDTMGYWTIGYGHCTGNELPTLIARGISEEFANELLEGDIQVAIEQTELLCLKHSIDFDKLSDARQRVLVNMCFNLGAVGLSKFKRMWYCIAYKDWNGAAEEMLESSWSKQVKGRAARLATMMKEG